MRRSHRGDRDARNPGGVAEIPAYACRHNVNYWRGGSFYGLGPSATTYAQGKNLKTDYLDGLIKFRKGIEPKDVDAFCAAGKVGPARP